MRKYDPTDEFHKYEQEDAEKLGAKPWQLELLMMNPSYTSWGPHEDYMAGKDGDGWNSNQYFDNWKGFSWGLNDLNELVNFYFAINRESKDCPTCAGNSYHPDAQWISESFYSHSSPFKRQTFREQQAAAIMNSFGSVHKSAIEYGFPSEEVLAKYGPEFRAFCERMRTKNHWSDDITQDELNILKAEGRVRNADATVEQINAHQRGRGMGHDAINRCILIRARCERLGVPCACPECNGSGYVYTAPEPHVSLVLWIIHPRKGAARGVEIKNVEQEDLPAVFEFLREARQRNHDRFGKIPG